MKKILFEAIGRRFLRQMDEISQRENIIRKDIRNMQQISAARLLSVSHVDMDGAVLFCGRQNKALPILKYLTRKSGMPFVMIGRERDFSDSCLLNLGIDWQKDAPPARLPSGNGIIALRAGMDSCLELKRHICNWEDHTVILCTGNGLQIDCEMLNQLNSLCGGYIILTESLWRSVRNSESGGFGVKELIRSMDSVIVSSIGMAAKELIEALPDYEAEIVNVSTDYSLHSDNSNYYGYGGSHSGKGLRLSRSVAPAIRPVLLQSELTKMQDSNIMMIYNSELQHIWAGKVTR